MVKGVEVPPDQLVAVLELLEHALRLRECLPQARLFLMYGLTECMRASYLPPQELERRPDSVGRGIPFQEHWLQDLARSDPRPIETRVLETLDALSTT